MHVGSRAGLPFTTQFFALNYISQKSVRHRSFGSCRVACRGSGPPGAQLRVFPGCWTTFPRGPCAAPSPELERSEVPAGRGLLSRGLSGLSIPRPRSRVDLKPCAPSSRPVGRGAPSGEWLASWEGSHAPCGGKGGQEGAPGEEAGREARAPGPGEKCRGARGCRGPGTPGRGQAAALWL